VRQTKETKYETREGDNDTYETYDETDERSRYETNNETD
jgi:hypothetical protein